MITELAGGVAAITKAWRIDHNQPKAGSGELRRHAADFSLIPLSPLSHWHV
jgi:hypothetical protein